jgi:hypothetical protein
MDKQTIYKFIAIGVAAVVLFLGDIMLFGSSAQSSQQQVQSYMIGVLDAQYSIESYKGIVEILNPVNFSQIKDNISAMPGVKKVYENPTEILITTDNESASMDIYRFADGKYGTVLSKAVLTPLGNGTLNGTYAVNVSLPLEVYLKPTMGLGSSMDIRADALVVGGSVNVMQNAVIVSERKRIDLVGPILNVSEKTYSYEIDFVNRTMVADYPNATAEISNIVYLNSMPLARKGYVDWVGDSYIIVNGSMTNETAIAEDYGNATFPSSYIKSAAPLNISFAKGMKEVMMADVSLENSPYRMPDSMVTVSLEDGRNATSMALVLNAEISGNVVLDYIIIGNSPVYS